MNKSIQHLISLTFLIWIAGTLYGCAQNNEKYVRDGVEYGFTSKDFSGQWWEYYERGRSFADGGFYREALADLQLAVSSRSKDHRQAQTVGNHLIDYFPHRELGIIYFQRKEYNLASIELELSIDSVPSARAHFFLNKARAAGIIRHGTDFRPPVLNIAGKTSLGITNKFSWTVKGVASDDTFVAAIKVGAQQIPMELSVPKKVFSVEIPLHEGENIIGITATDIAGKSTEQLITLYSDRQGPQIEIEELTVADNQVRVKGSVSDNKRLSSLKINHRRWPISGTAPGYNFKVLLPEGQITVVARDQAGNVTRAVVREHTSDLQQNNTQNITDQSAEKSRVPSEAAMSLPEDNVPPYIRIKNLDPVQETYDDTVLLQVQVSDNSLLKEITVNGETIPSRRGRSMYFTLHKKLQKGVNNFYFEATDEYGNRADKKITLNRETPNMYQIDSRMSIAILPFGRKGGTSSQGNILHDQLINSFEKLARFNITERQETNSIMRELELPISQRVNLKQAVDLGLIAATQGVLTGTITQDSDSIEITAQLIDTETGTILSHNDIAGEDRGQDSIADLLDHLANKFKRDFPLIEGTVLEVTDGEVLISAGRDKQVRSGTYLTCYRQCPPTPHPVTGQLRSSEPQVVGKLKVQEVFDDFSRAAPLNRDNSCIVSDKVISR